MKEYYPPVGFHFSVSLGSEATSKAQDSRFQSVAGLNVELETETVKEGGENRYEHVLPVRTKYPNLTLKRGMFVDSELISWCLNTFENLEIVPTDILISLLNSSHEPLKSWKIKNAWPLKWNVADLSGEENKLVIETIELRYQYFTLE